MLRTEALNLHLSVRTVADSLPKEGWCEVEFLVEWKNKELTCLAVGLEAFACYVKGWQGVSEAFGAS